MKNILRILLFVVLSKSCFALNIEDTIKSTIKNNPKVKIAIEKLNESKELLIYSKGYKLPTVTSSITGTYLNSDTKTSVTNTTPETFTDSYKLTITQNLYDAGFNDLEIERSKILFNNEIIGFNNTIQSLILDAIEGYLSVINFEKSLESTQKNYDSVLKGFEETKTRFDLGSATLYDIQNSEASFAIAKTNLYAAQQNVNIGKKTFKRIVGLKPINLEDVLNIGDMDNLETINKNAEKNNLNLLLISNDIAIKEILILKEKKSKQLNIDLTGTGLYSNSDRIDNGSENTSGSVAITLTIPLYKKGQDNSNIRKYQSQKIQSEINLQDSKDDLSILIANTYKDFKINESKMQSNLIIIKSIKTSLSSLQEEYEIGTKSINDLIEEEEKLLEANVNYLDSKKHFLLSYFKIKSLDGSLINLFKNYIPEIN